MSNENMHTTVRVDTASDTKAVDNLLSKIRAISVELRKLGAGSTKSLNDDLAKVSGTAEKVNKALNLGQEQGMSALRKRFTFESRMNRQREKEASDAAKAEKLFNVEALSALRERMTFQSRMQRQAAQEARDLARVQADAARQAARAARDSTREQAAAVKAQIAQAKELEQARSRALRTAASSAGRVRQGVGRAAVVGAASGAVLGAGARRGLDKLTSSGIGIDEALTQAQIHIFGTQSTGESRKSAEALRKRLMSVAVSLGSKTSDLIGAYVEASQAGVDSDILDKVVGLGSKYAKMNKLSLPNTLEESGYALQGLKAFGAVTDETVAKYFNHMSYLVATTAANRTQMSSFGKRGLAAGASVGMSADDALAFGAAATAAGAEGSQAARMLSSQGGRIAGWQMKSRDIQRKRTKTEEDRLFLQAPSLTGFGNYQNLAASFKKDFFDTFARLQEGLKRITDPLKRRAVEKQLLGQEFGSFTDAMIMGGNLREYRNKLKSPEADNFIDQNWSKQTGSFGFIVEQIKSVFGNLSDSLGLALKPFWSDLRDWAVQTPKAFQQFEDAFTASIKGFLTGLGSPDGSMAGLLKAWLGDPADFKVNTASWGAFARGFGDGIRSVMDGIKRLLGVFSGGSSDPEVLGRLSGKLITLSSALVIASPAITLLGALSTAVLGFATAFRALGVVGAGGAEAAGAAGSGIIARLGLATLARRLLERVMYLS